MVWPFVLIVRVQPGWVWMTDLFFDNLIHNVERELN